MSLHQIYCKAMPFGPTIRFVLQTKSSLSGEMMDKHAFSEKQRYLESIV